jgi:ABC-type transport system involved in cytochrome c biogenesis permease subunit
VERARGVLLVAFVTSVVQQAILAALALTLMADPELPQPLWIAVQAASTGLLAAAAFAVGRRLRSGMAARRSNRSRRLHLD